jgi:hypothetical protein
MYSSSLNNFNYLEDFIDNDNDNDNNDEENPKIMQNLLLNTFNLILKKII